MCADRIQLREESCAGEPLLQQVMSHGRRLLNDDLHQARERCRQELARLPEALRGLDPVPALRELAESLDR